MAPVEIPNLGFLLGSAYAPRDCRLVRDYKGCTKWRIDPNA